MIGIRESLPVSVERVALAVALGLLQACAHPASTPERMTAPVPPPASARVAASAPRSVTLTLFEGFPETPAWPEALPEFAPLVPVFAACPALRPSTTAELPGTPGAATTLALPDGREARIAWEGDPDTLRLRIQGAPRARPGVALTYQLVRTGGAILFWGPSRPDGGEADAGSCAYVVVGYGG